MNETNGHGPRSQLERLRAAPGPQRTLNAITAPSQRSVAGPQNSLVPNADDSSPSDPRVRDMLAMVTAVLDGMDAKYFREGDDAIGGIWENGYFYFFALADPGDSPFLQVYGQWDRMLPQDLYLQAAIFVNEWNAERTWPKAFARALDDDPSIGIYGEVTVDLGPTATLDQVDRVLNVGLASSLALFDEAQLTFPESVHIDT